jgi:hypothetical protein
MRVGDLDCGHPALSWLNAFSKKFPKGKTMLVNGEGLEKFLLTSAILKLLD